MTVGLAWTLTLVSAYLLGSTPPALPEEQGEHGLTDGALYDQITSENGDPLGSMSFSQACLTDCRRIDGLILQRVIRPFYLAITKIRYPQTTLSNIQDAMRHAYLQRNADLRASGGAITSCELAKDYAKSWQANSDVLKVAFEMQSPAAGVFKDLLKVNRQDIRRAFREAHAIARRAEGCARESGREDCSRGWAEIAAVLKNMSDTIERYLVDGLGAESIDDEIEWIASESFAGLTDSATDLFGAVSMDEVFGSSFQFEEHILSGHRAPAVALSQYRRMGGRFYS